jgi:ornithine cyclodeaminase
MAVRLAPVVVRILRRADVEAALGMAACIDAVEAAFVAYSAGRTELPGVIHLEVPEAGGEIHVKAGHLHGAPAYAVKVASGFYGAAEPSIDGLVLVFDAATGSLRALLLDGGALTDLRTGAAGGVAARLLAPERVGHVAVLGTGIQARRQVDALRVVRPEALDVRVWGRDPAKAAAAAAEIGGRPATSVREAVEGADVILTCTASREPLVDAAWVSPGAHITAVGSDGAGKQELDPEILRRADVLAVDALDQAVRLGELQHAAEEAGRAVELGVIAAGDALGRTEPAQLTVCDLTGVGVQDVAAANVVLTNAPPDAGDVIAS